MFRDFHVHRLNLINIKVMPAIEVGLLLWEKCEKKLAVMLIRNEKTIHNK
jgi:hypothetical protein